MTKKTRNYLKLAALAILTYAMTTALVVLACWLWAGGKP